MKRSAVIILISFLLAGCAAGKSSHAQTPAEAAPEVTAISTENSGALEFTDDYPYDIAEDRKSYDGHVDFTVGDKMYSAQINDWYINFPDYAGAVVEIEGFFLQFDRYLYIGRKGPSCPYCIGGYVDFEFATDSDVSEFESGKTWIKVIGYLREGTMNGGKTSKPFYYIEAMSVEVCPEGLAVVDS